LNYLVSRHSKDGNPATESLEKHAMIEMNGFRLVYYGRATDRAAGAT
jgi:hypothetical protein